MNASSEAKQVQFSRTHARHMLTSQGANAAGEQQRQWMFLKQDSLTEASLSPPIIIDQWVNDPSASGGSATVVEGRIAIIHRSMITRHRAVQGAAAVVVILVPALASRFACDVKGHAKSRFGAASRDQNLGVGDRPVRSADPLL